MTVSQSQPIPLFHAALALRGRALAAIVVGCGLSYGAIMGTFGLGHGRELQVLLSAVKVPLLLLGTFAIALPSFVVLNTLLGLRADLRAALLAHLQAQASITVVLCSLAPLTLMWYASVEAYPLAILFNAAMFGVAALAGQVVLRRLYAPLVRRDPRHRLMLRLWLALYAFVGIQMGWVLRPFIGNPQSPVEAFRSGAWGNAYQELWQIVRSALG